MGIFYKKHRILVGIPLWLVNPPIPLEQASFCQDQQQQQLWWCDYKWVDNNDGESIVNPISWKIPCTTAEAKLYPPFQLPE